MVSSVVDGARFRHVSGSPSESSETGVGAPRSS